MLDTLDYIQQNGRSFFNTRREDDSFDKWEMRDGYAESTVGSNSEETSSKFFRTREMLQR